MTTSDRSTQPWFVPHPQNPFFTGRSKILRDIQDFLEQEGSVVLDNASATGGVGGLGKTQTALAYAHRARDRYQGVFWVDAHSEASRLLAFWNIAKALELCVVGPHPWVAAHDVVCQWVEEHAPCLLIFDNVSTEGLTRFSFPHPSSGHVLLLPRHGNRDHSLSPQPMPTIELEGLPPEEGIRFLFKRTGRLGTDSYQRKGAGKIVEAFGGLPAALEWAGAYMLDKDMGFKEYLKELGVNGEGTSEPSLRKTAVQAWTLTINAIASESQISIELLQGCVYLGSAPIPFDLLIPGTDEFGSFPAPLLQQGPVNPTLVDRLVAPLLRYGLLHHAIEPRQVTVPPFAQELLNARLGPETRRRWAERTVNVAHRVLVSCENDTGTMPAQIFSLLEAGTVLAKEGTVPSELAADLLQRMGVVLDRHAGFSLAEPYFKSAAFAQEALFGETQYETSGVWHDLACRYVHHKKRKDADFFFRRALTTLESAQGSTPMEVASYANALARRYKADQRSTKADEYFVKSLSIREAALGPAHLDLATYCHDLALQYATISGRMNEADALFKRSLAIREAALGPTHLDLATYCHALGLHYTKSGRLNEADAFFTRSLAIREATVGPGDLELALYCHDLAMHYTASARIEKAEPLFNRSMAIRSQTVGSTHPDVGLYLQEVAGYYRDHGLPLHAEPLIKRALFIAKKHLAPNNPDLCAHYNTLAQIYHALGRYNQAEPLYKRALSMREQTDTPDRAAILNNLGGLYHQQGKYRKAEPFLRRALTLARHTLPPDSLELAICLNNLGALYCARRKYPQAEPFLTEALAIRQHHVPTDHPDLLTIIENLALLLRRLRRSQEAGMMEARATGIRGLATAQPQPA